MGWKSDEAHLFMGTPRGGTVTTPHLFGGWCQANKKTNKTPALRSDSSVKTVSAHREKNRWGRLPFFFLFLATLQRVLFDGNVTPRTYDRQRGARENGSTGSALLVQIEHRSTNRYLYRVLKSRAVPQRDRMRKALICSL